MIEFIAIFLYICGMITTAGWCLDAKDSNLKSLEIILIIFWPLVSIIGLCIEAKEIFSNWKERS